MTQEQLASRLGISYQAISKWENGISCPDIMILPQLAEIFGISIDALFGRASEIVPAEPASAAPGPFVGDLPWPDDDGLYAVVYRGHELLACEGLNGGRDKQIHIHFESAINGIKRFFSRTIDRSLGSAYAVELHYEGPVRNLTTTMAVHCRDCKIEGNVQAGDGVNCGDVGGNVQAGDGVNCGNVGGNLTAGDSVNCGSIGGDASAGDSLSCGAIGGDAHAGDSIRSNGDIGGNAQAGDSVNCGNVHGDVHCDGDVRCSNVEGDVHAGGDIHMRKTVQ